MKGINLTGLDMKKFVGTGYNPSQDIINTNGRDDGRTERLKDSLIQRNKRWRNLKKDQKYITRIKLHAAYWYNPDKTARGRHWTELYNSKYTFAYKTTSTPCSCPICKGERYNRRQFKKETRELLNLE